MAGRAPPARGPPPTAAPSSPRRSAGLWR